MINYSALSTVVLVCPYNKMAALCERSYLTTFTCIVYFIIQFALIETVWLASGNKPPITSFHLFNRVKMMKL